MKTKFFTLLFLLLLGSTSVFAQGPWFTLGNTTGPGNYLGTNNNQPLNFRTNGTQRFHINAGTGMTSGYVGIGNGFTNPQNRLHLYQPGGSFGMQLTNTSSGSTATDGFAMNLQNNSSFNFQQYENQNVRFIMPGSTLMELSWNAGPGNIGQVRMRPGPNPLVGFPAVAAYSPAQLNIGGPIGFSAVGGPGIINTILYANTSAQGSTLHGVLDGFRILHHFDSEGTPNSDCLVFEKTDGQQNDPDGCIKFTNFGADAIRELTMTLEGNGHVGIGTPFTTSVQPWRRLSVQDTVTQFRLSFMSTNNLSTEIYTDFFTDGGGNLWIDPRFGSNTNAGVVRINYGTGLVAPHPNLSLDVNGQMNIRTVNTTDSLTYVLVWEPVTGRVHRLDASMISNFAACGDTTGELSYDSHVNLNNFNFYFQGQGPIGDDQVAVGYNCGDPLLGKLNVLVDTVGVTFGVWTYMNAPNFNNSGGVFRVINATDYNIGVQGSGSGGLNGYGGIFSGQGTQNSYGVYASSSGGALNNYAGYFVGDVFTTGAYLPSDVNLKHSIDSLSLDSASYYINALNPSSFLFQTSTYPFLNLSDGHQYGLIAQEVEQVIPSCIKEINHPAQYDSAGVEISPAMTFKGIDYEQFIPILIADAQNKNQDIDSLNSIVVVQDSIIDDLNNRLTYLENCLSNILPYLCDMNSSMIIQNSEQTQEQLKNTLDVYLQNEATVILNQNAPNPFAEQTIISYSIPESVKHAQILFYDENGRLIKAVDLDQRGLGQLNVFGSDLSSGIYSYTLVADGVVVATKQMVKTQ